MIRWLISALGEMRCLLAAETMDALRKRSGKGTDVMDTRCIRGVLSAVKDVMDFSNGYEGLACIKHAVIEDEDYAAFVFPNTVYSVKLDTSSEEAMVMGILDFVIGI